jgi:hypothetical protein
MASQTGVNLDLKNNSDGFEISGGTTRRKLTHTGADAIITAAGSAVHTFPAATDTLAGLGTAQTFTAIQKFDVPPQVKAGTSTGNIAKVGGCIFDHFADVTIGGTEAQIWADSIPANALATNGDKIVANYGGNFVTVGTELTQLLVKFGGTTIWDSTGVAPATGTTSWRVVAELIRVSSSVIRYTVSLNTTTGTTYAYATSGELTGLTLSGANFLELKGASSGVGSGSGDIIGKMGSVYWYPAA